MGWWQVQRTWYVEADTYADAMMATGKWLDHWMPFQWRRRIRAGEPTMVQARAQHMLAAECCGGTGLYEPNSVVPCANPRCPVLHPDKYVQE
jgi:hypothetical protein